MGLAAGDKLTLEIGDIAFGGEGVARVDDFVVFVPFVALGELVEAEITETKKRFARARLLQVIRPSPERTQPSCPYFGQCGGCQYQHLAYPEQLRLKQKQVADHFQRIGGLDPALIEPVIPCPQPYGYRNRIMIRSQWDKFKQGLNIGFIRADNRLVIDIDQCKIAEPALNQEILRVRAHPPPKGGLKVVLRIPPEGWEVPPDSFFQNNFFLLPRLVEVVRERLRDSGARYLADIYCGVGFFSLELADQVEFFVGVEYDRMAIQAARRNAANRKRTNGEFVAGTAEELLPALLANSSPAELDQHTEAGVTSGEQFRLPRNQENLAGTASSPQPSPPEKTPQSGGSGVERSAGVQAAAVQANALSGLSGLRTFSAEATAVLLDPPRKGCRPETLEALRRARPAQIIYVSCDPATMARDLNVLCAEGVFKIARMVPLDMFPQTAHIECVADLRSPDSAAGEFALREGASAPSGVKNHVAPQKTGAAGAKPRLPSP